MIGFWVKVGMVLVDGVMDQVPVQPVKEMALRSGVMPAIRRGGLAYGMCGRASNRFPFELKARPGMRAKRGDGFWVRAMVLLVVAAAVAGGALEHASVVGAVTTMSQTPLASAGEMIWFSSPSPGTVSGSVAISVQTKPGLGEQKVQLFVNGYLALTYMESLALGAGGS